MVLFQRTLGYVKSPRVLAVGVLFLVIFMSRLPLVLVASQKLFLSIDELELTQSSVDRFLGVPHTETCWPGTTNHLVLVPLVIVDYLRHSRLAVSPSSFVDYLSHFYRDPWRFFLLARLVVTIIATFGLAMLLPNLARHVGSVCVAAIALLLLATVPNLMIVSAAAFGMGIALGLSCLAIAFALTPSQGGRLEPYVTLTAGMAFGLALAGRNIVLPLAPLIAALLATRSKSPWRTIIVFCVTAGLTLLFACPQIWVEPIRWTKATLGNYHQRGTPIGALASVQFLVQEIPLWLLCAFGAASIRLLQQRAWFVIVGTVIGTLAMIVLAAGAPRTPTVLRHYDAMIILTGVVASLGLGPLITSYLYKQSTNRRAWRYLAVLAAIVVILAGNGLGTYLGLQTTLQSGTDSIFASGKEVEAFRIQVRKYAHRKVLVPLALLPWVTDLASVESLKATADSANAALRAGNSTAAFTASFGLDPMYTTALADDFNEKEQAFAARFRVMAAGKEHGSVDITFYDKSDIAARYRLLPVDEAVSGFKVGLFDALVVLRSLTPLIEPNQKLTPIIGIVTSP